MTKPLAEDHFLNRELSWLDFNERVLALAEDHTTPLLERAKFLAIFASGLDEFYMVRVAGLQQQIAAGLSTRGPDGMTSTQQMEAITDRVLPLIKRHAQIFIDDVMPELGKAGIEILRWKELSDSQREDFNRTFEEEIFPVLTPLAVDPGHPFPYISNLSLNLAVLVRDPLDDRVQFARVKVPPLLPRFLSTSGKSVFVPIEDAISANLDRLFRGMEVVEHHAFRVTRDADLEVNDDRADDLLQAVEEELQKRRFSPAVRLEVESDMPPHVLDLIQRELPIGERDVHQLVGPLDLSGLSTFYSLDHPELKDETFVPATHPALVSADESSKTDVFAAIKKRDILVHHPYYSFATSVQRFIEQAAEDPNVLAIKQTLYRTSGQSPIVDALITAAEAGKAVAVLVEIKARFDEQRNIVWARALEQAGCHVAYGVVGLKTHCKLSLVVRQEGKNLQRYVHVGTGNYNPTTARLYEDFGLLSADPQLGADVADLFNYLTGYSRRAQYRTLLVAPSGMREQLIWLIEREAEHAREGRPARIIMKANNFIDEKLIEALYEASQAGVEIDLIIRSICGLRPGVEGLSPTIRVRSILGRFLEHSRIYWFGNGGDEEMHIGSADLMHRNLDRRVEALVKARSVEVKEQLREFLDLALADNFSAWILHADGSWVRSTPGEDDVIDLQSELMRRAAARVA